MANKMSTPMKVFFGVLTGLAGLAAVPGVMAVRELIMNASGPMTPANSPPPRSRTRGRAFGG